MLSQAKYLSAASAVEYALQLVLPIYLVRALSADDFASYRFIWLLVSTAGVMFMLGLPRSLSYYLPRAEGPEQVAYLTQTTLFCTLMGGLAVLTVELVRHAFPDMAAMRMLPHRVLPVYLFFLLFFATTVIEALPLAQGEIRMQAVINVVSAIVRVAATAAGAWYGSIDAICWAMVVFALARWLMLQAYRRRFLPADGLPPTWPRLRDQLGYAVPFGVSGAFYLLRGQAEQWVAASMLPPVEYASVSIAAVVSPFVLLIRTSISRSILPSMNEMARDARHAEMIALNSRGNIVTTSMLVPTVAFVFAFSDVIVAHVYTAKYQAAASVMRVICVGLLAYCVEFSSINASFRIGKSVAMFDGVLLLFSVSLSSMLARSVGIQGVVVGSMLGLYLGAAFGCYLTVKQLGVPARSTQHWSAIFRYVLAGAVTAGSAFAVVHGMRPAFGDWVAAPAGLLVFAALYILATRTLGVRLVETGGGASP